MDQLYAQARLSGESKAHVQQKSVSKIGDELAAIIKRETGETMPCSSCKQEIARLNLLTADEVLSQKTEIARGILDRGRKISMTVRN